MVVQQQTVLALLPVVRVVVLHIRSFNTYTIRVWIC